MQEDETDTEEEVEQNKGKRPRREVAPKKQAPQQVR